MRLLPTPNVPAEVDALAISQKANDITGAVTTTLASRDGHEEHPESMHPRVFFSVVQSEPANGTTFYVRHYELLRTGYAIPWRTLPEGKFDYLHFILPTMKALRLSHADAPSAAFWSGTMHHISEPVGPSIPTLEMK